MCADRRQLPRLLVMECFLVSCSSPSEQRPCIIQSRINFENRTSALLYLQCKLATSALSQILIQNISKTHHKCTIDMSVYLNNNIGSKCFLKHYSFLRDFNSQTQEVQVESLIFTYLRMKSFGIMSLENVWTNLFWKNNHVCPISWTNISPKYSNS